MEKKLSEFKKDEKGIVKKIIVTGRIRQRLYDMGITNLTEITFKKASPLGDPLEIKVRGYALSLRKEEAEGIIMEVCES